jgi:hypothetical protein
MARAAPDYDLERGASSAAAPTMRRVMKLLTCVFPFVSAERCKTFLTTFASAYDADGTLKYMEQLVRGVDTTTLRLLGQMRARNTELPFLTLDLPPVSRLAGARSKRSQTGHAGRWTSPWTT